MVERRKEAPVNPSKTFRLIAVTMVVSALAVLLTSPAHAYWENDSSAPAAPAPVAAPSGGAEGTSYGTILAVAGGTVVVLLLGAGALLVATRHRRVALP
jgi:hypothetical protein